MQILFLLRILLAFNIIGVNSAAVSSRCLNLKSLQAASNGFDLRGIYTPTHAVASYDSRRLGPPLTGDSAFWVGFGFMQYLKKFVGSSSQPIKVGIGRDSRPSGPDIVNWIIGGVEKAGGIGYAVGLCTTPAMYLSCVADASEVANLPRFDGAISVTASHLPTAWNGFKLFTVDEPSNIGDRGIESIIDLISASDFDSIVPAPTTGDNCDFNHAPPRFLPVYSNVLKQTVRKFIEADDDNDGVSFPLRGLKIVVNAGNGAGGFLSATLAELGADTSASIHLEPDGTFPNHIANPEDKEAIAATRRQVLESGADLGICLDTDADRVGLVEGGGSGRLLNRNNLVALVSAVALKENPGGLIVTDSATSNGVTRFIQDTLKGTHFRFKKGYRYVIEKGRSLPGCVAAVECSGHGAWADNGWVDDGCYTAVKLLAALCNVRRKGSAEGKQLGFSDLLDGLLEPVESLELRLIMKQPIPDGKTPMEVEALALAAMRRVVTAFHTPGKENEWVVEPVNWEGLRASFAIRGSTGWCMLRKSLHEPILSMQIEAEQEWGAAAAGHAILYGDGGLNSLRQYLDLTPLVDLASKRLH